MMIGDLFVQALGQYLGIALGLIAAVAGAFLVWWRGRRRKRVQPMEKWGKLRD